MIFPDKEGVVRDPALEPRSSNYPFIRADNRVLLPDYRGVYQLRTWIVLVPVLVVAIVLGCVYLYSLSQATETPKQKQVD